MRFSLSLIENIMKGNFVIFNTLYILQFYYIFYIFCANILCL